MSTKHPQTTDASTRKSNESTAYVARWRADAADTGFESRLVLEERLGGDD